MLSVSERLLLLKIKISDIKYAYVISVADTLGTQFNNWCVSETQNVILALG